MEKKKLRKKYKELRANLSEEEIDTKSLTIANHSLELDIWDYEYYHIFLPIVKQKEVDTSYILNILQGKDKHILISKSAFTTNRMKHYLLTDTTRFVINDYGIPEPENGIEIDSKKIDTIFNSNLVEIKEKTGILLNESKQKIEIENDLVYIFAGGELPTQFLQNAGIEIKKRFGYVMKSHKK